MVDDLDPAAHHGTPAGLNPAASYVWADVRDPDEWPQLRRASTRCATRRPRSASASTSPTSADYVGRNDFGHRGAAAGAARRGVRRAAGAGVEHGRLRRGPIPLRRPRRGAPGPRRVADLDAGRFEPPCPPCGAQLTPEAVPEDHWLDPRNVYATTKLAQEHLFAAYAREHAGRAVDRAALPQRVRAADASRHAVRRGGQPLPQRLRTRRGATRVRGRRPAPRLRPRHATSPTPTCWRSTNDEPAPRPVQRVQRRAAHRARHGRRAATRRRAGIRRSWAATDSATSATCSPARSGPRQVLGFRAAVSFEDGMRDFSTSPLRSRRPRPVGTTRSPLRHQCCLQHDRAGRLHARPRRRTGPATRPGDERRAGERDPRVEQQPDPLHLGLGVLREVRHEQCSDAQHRSATTSDGCAARRDRPPSPDRPRSAQHRCCRSRSSPTGGTVPNRGGTARSSHAPRPTTRSPPARTRRPPRRRPRGRRG